ncbi:rRNA maturation RNase YbeY [Aquisalimonas asiatica]|uniref:Endoribonuclease YbeY n=1 Tax=Aquisalimonas asiatica TaxID=406100 RepID=A0A1H8UVM3_9GAMM|nr:rRNA maturation RNase YbeY [Aquisalimonas asiatica]SEP07270.1 probable rRNA maturation factor [Aquisalimonas asiatica]
MIDVAYQVACDGPSLPDESAVTRWVEAALAGRRDAAEVVVRVAGEEEARALNRDYRGRDYATNVLSFPFEAPPGFDDLPELGDLVICAEVVAREAAEQDKPVQNHWAHLVIHGTLHLLGYDHIEEAEAAVMEGLERDILAALGIPDPYRGEAADL